ncbi:exopolyphosphatase / guanosine-5'-triphosphate,3'-diphosphate pyrophosphatase [Fulvimarina manganoxydans]|uniref:Exopolyphosphatase / guanosine-5'-triphosphate,3'-diphosphate pyrophosphatase n=1 Tax=Fulvimarina manganoxydans TaxID=937218 RepID=A0A1W1ZU48_9HYPH|nr:exopolyphosphatase / guanosine-5'-triphosphate,3'-diphosphate pyrophosphatase [Fulvimarina manganoxydans]
MLQSSSQNKKPSTHDSIEPLGQGRIIGRRPVGVVDIGSNSVRLVIYEGNSRALTVLFNEKVLSGLGKGLAQTNRLDGQAVSSALNALKRFRRLADQAGVEALYPLATAASREAVNGPEFLSAAEAAIGRPIAILSGEDEARYAAEGVMSGFHKPDGIVGDLGGGSLELVEVANGQLGQGLTLPLGGLRLRDIAGGDLKQAQSVADSHVASSALARQGTGRPFYAVGGTWRNLARLHMEQAGYPLHVMHGYTLAAGGSLDKFLDSVVSGDPDRLPGIAAVSKSRRALLAYGAVTMRSVMKFLKPSSIVTSALGVREGYLHSLLPEEERDLDPLIEAARELAVLRSRSPDHAEELVTWSTRTFEAFGIVESEEEKRLRAAACLLADIGWRAHPDYRGRQSLSIITHAAFPAIDHRGRAYLGLTNFFRHEGTFEQTQVPDLETLVDSHLLERARMLGSLFRVTYLLTASMPGVLDRFRWAQDPRGGFTLVIPAELGDLIGERPEGRLQQFSKLVGQPLRLEAR